MNHLNIFLLILINNSFLISMETEHKNVLLDYYDSQNQRWYIDKEIQGHEDAIFSVSFNKSGTKIRAWLHPDDYIYTLNRVDGEELDKILSDEFCATEESSEESSEEQSKDYNVLKAYKDSRYQRKAVMFWAICKKKESEWLEKLLENLGDVYPQTNESKKIMVVWGSDKSTAYVWDRKEKKEASQLSHKDKINSLFLSHSGKIVTTSDCTMRVWNGLTGEELLLVICDTKVMSAVLNVAETEIVIATDDGKISILVKKSSK